MSFPVINYKFNDIEEAKSLSDLVEQKFSSLAKFVSDDGSTSCEVVFSKIATHQQGQIHKFEATVTSSSSVYRADAVEESFEKAIDEVRSELDKEMRRAKDKQVTQDKQAGREAKDQMLGE